MKPLIQIVGPSFTNYSLARVNRGLASALAKTQSEYEIKVISRHPYAERDPDERDLKAYPELTKLFAQEIDPEGIVIYNNFPKDPAGLHGLADIPAALKLVYLAWETSAFPQHWVEEFNREADGVIAAANFVREVFHNSGIQIPLLVAWNAIDEEIIHGQPKAANIDLPNNKFKFLHVSSGFPRKGTDVLLKAYSEEFTAADNVTLLLKSLPSAINKIPGQVAELQQNPNLASIQLINQELSDHELLWLTQQSDCCVYPTRAEGFGLPIAEAMLWGKPVIATGYGAHLDFFDEQSGYVLDYSYQPATGSHLVDLGAYWAEPSVEHLRKLLRQAYEEHNTPKQQEMIKQAKLHAEQLTWAKTAAKFIDYIKQLQNISSLHHINKVVIGERNNQSGVAEHANNLHTRIDRSFASTTYLANADVPDLANADANNIIRNWNSGEIEFTQVKAYLEEHKPEIVHIEYHANKTKPQDLIELAKSIHQSDSKLYITLHSSSDGPADIRPYVSDLNKVATKIIVHSQIELKKLQEAGFNNLYHMHMGNNLPIHVNTAKLKSIFGLSNAYPIMATHGILHDRKGVDKLIIAANKLRQQSPELHLLLINAVNTNNISSQGSYEKYTQLIDELDMANHITWVTDFLTESEVLTILSAADINILAYEDIGEGASGAIQKLIAANKPILLTAANLFNEFKLMSMVVNNNDPTLLADGIRKLLNDEAEQTRQKQLRQQYLDKNNWYSKSIELLQLYLEK